MFVFVKINNDSGINLGPFQLTANIGTVTPATATRQQLIEGLVVEINEETATQVTITSTGTCSNSVILSIVNSTTTAAPVSTTTSTSTTSTSSTTTSTSTSTTTIPPCNEYTLSQGSYSFINCSGNPQTVNVPEGDSVNVCARTNPGGGAILVGNCYLTTTTTTLTPTTTTTIEPTTSTTTQALEEVTLNYSFQTYGGIYPGALMILENDNPVLTRDYNDSGSISVDAGSVINIYVYAGDADLSQGSPDFSTTLLVQTNGTTIINNNTTNPSTNGSFTASQPLYYITATASVGLNNSV